MKTLSALKRRFFRLTSTVKLGQTVASSQFRKHHTLCCLRCRYQFNLRWIRLCFTVHLLLSNRSSQYIFKYLSRVDISVSRHVLCLFNVSYLHIMYLFFIKTAFIVTVLIIFLYLTVVFSGMHQTIGAFLPDIQINAGPKFLVVYPDLVICEI